MECQKRARTGRQFAEYRPREFWKYDWNLQPVHDILCPAQENLRASKECDIFDPAVFRPFGRYPGRD